MQKSYKKRFSPAEWINPLNLIPREFPTAILVFGVLANFAWLAVVFWFLSYWIVWHF
jgi:Mg/Co/Ni transporter MgtE